MPILKRSEYLTYSGPKDIHYWRRERALARRAIDKMLLHPGSRNDLAIQQERWSNADEAVRAFEHTGKLPLWAVENA